MTVSLASDPVREGTRHVAVLAGRSPARRRVEHDPLGFDRWQRLALKGAGVLIGAGFVLGVAYGYVTIPPFGVVLWLGFVVLAAAVVCVTLVWRLAQVLVSNLAEIGVGGT